MQHDVGSLALCTLLTPLALAGDVLLLGFVVATFGLAAPWAVETFWR